MWKTLCTTARGTSHERSGQPCQDYCTAAEVPLADQRVLILACADGAGSAEFSQVGSRIACETIVRSIVEGLHEAGGVPFGLEAQAIGWVQPVHDALVAEAAVREIEPRQLACTLLYAVLGERSAAFGQIGDGAIVTGALDCYEHVLWPQSGEYANTTFFVTDPQFATHLQCLWCSAPVDDVALFTDGVQTLALDFAKRQAHGPFFAPMFETLRRESRPETLLTPFSEFLQSPAVSERTDDDKTLILATRARNE
jgi:hypothetical protein